MKKKLMKLSFFQLVVLMDYFLLFDKKYVVFYTQENTQWKLFIFFSFFETFPNYLTTD